MVYIEQLHGSVTTRRNLSPGGVQQRKLWHLCNTTHDPPNDEVAAESVTPKERKRKHEINDIRGM